MAQLSELYFNIRDYGARGDGRTDDAKAIDAAVKAAAKQPNAVLLFPPAAGYAAGSTVSIPPGLHVEMQAPLLYRGNGNTPALVIGAPAALNGSRRLRIQVQRPGGADWSKPNSVGVRLVNCNTCFIEIDQADGFAVGVQCMGDRQGFAYNHAVLGLIVNNRIGVDLTNQNSGWCNENLFLNGRFGCYTGVNPGQSRYGVRITSVDGSYRNNNNNVFVKPSFELNASEAGSAETLPILIEHGLQNAFVSCRTENSGPLLARLLNESSENTFDIGYGSEIGTAVEETGKFPASLLLRRRTAMFEQARGSLFDSGPVHRTACLYDGTAAVHVPRVHIANAGDRSVNPALAGLTVAPDYLEVPATRGLGVFVDTSETKRFVVRRNVVAGYGGRVAVRCFSGTGTVLAGDRLYVQGYSYKPPYYSSNFGGVFLTGSDDDADYYFQVADSVTRIAVIVSGGTRPLRLKSFALASVNGDACAVWSGYEEGIPGVNLGIAPPRAGTWSAGRRILHAAPQPGQPEGWVCTASGTPGTWRPFGQIG